MGEAEKECLELERGDKLLDAYTVVRKLGEGGYGAVYEVECEGRAGKGGAGETKPRRYACKVEGAKEPLQALKMEVLVLQALEKANAVHACRMVEGGQNQRIRFIIMTMLGPSLQALRKERRSQCFSLSTALRVGQQCLEAVKELHDVGFLHRDLKPANLAIGQAEQNRTVFLLDFGISRKFRDENGDIRKPRKRAGFRGTLRYAPLACHQQKELSRKDDLESWLYMLVELSSGRVPWRELTAKDEVQRAKEEARTGKGLAALFRHCPDYYPPLLNLVDNTDFFARPAYEKMAFTLSCGLASSPPPNNRPDAPLDWEAPPSKPQPRTRTKSSDHHLPNKPRPNRAKPTLSAPAPQSANPRLPRHRPPA